MRKTVLPVLMCLLAASGVAAATAPAQAAPAAAPARQAASPHSPLDPTYLLKNVHSNLCASVVGASLTVAPLEQRPCDSANHAEVWFFAGGTATLQNYHSSYCAEPQGASGQAGVALLQTGCASQGNLPAEYWSTRSVAAGVLIQNYLTGGCAHVANASTAAGARLDQQPSCDGADHAMVWTLIRANP